MTEETLESVIRERDHLRLINEKQEQTIQLMGKRLFLIREAFKANMKVLTDYTDTQLDNFLTQIMLDTNLVEKIQNDTPSIIKPN
jgi:hypothetical protein